MKKILALCSLLATCGTLCADSWQENYPEDGLVLRICDTDGPKTNIRTSAGGAVACTLSTDSAYTFIVQPGMKAQNGWIRIPDDCVYWYDADTDGHGVDLESHGKAKQRRVLKGSKTGYWIHSSKVRLLLSSNIAIYSQPNTASDVIARFNYMPEPTLLEYQQGWLRVQTPDKKYSGWVESVQAIQHPLLFNDDCTCGEGMEEGVCCMGDNFYGALYVNDGLGIRQFVNALGLIPAGSEWDEGTEFDAKNGYFSFSQEGDGHVNYNAAIWNRKDGTKLFIFSYSRCELQMSYNPESDTDFVSPWGKVTFTNTIKIGTEEGRYFQDTGYRAFVYDAKQKALMPLEESPFVGLPESQLHRFFELPQQGKDIQVREFDPTNYDIDPVYHTLKWNGMTFDYIK